MLTALARQIEAASDDALVSIQLLDTARTHLDNIAAPSLPAPIIAATRDLPAADGVGACGTAAARGEAIITADIATNPRWEAYRAIVLAHSLRACWSLPIRTPGGVLLGAFATYRTKPGSPSTAEQQLLDRAIGIAALAIERTRAAATLRDNERDYRTLLEQAADAIVIVNQAGVIIRANAQACALTGYLSDELLGHSLLRILSPSDHAGFAERLDAVGTAPHVVEQVILRGDGTLRPIEASASRLDDGRLQIIARDTSARSLAPPPDLEYDRPSD